VAAARARTYRLSGEGELADTMFRTARAQAEQALARTMDSPRSRTEHMTELGEALAGLGKTEEAVTLGRRALEDVAHRGDAMDIAVVRMEVILRVLIPAGAVDLAFDELETYFAGPGPWSVEGLSRDPEVRSIRDDPRLEKLLTKYQRQ